jgi:hypothetical protein
VNDLLFNIEYNGDVLSLKPLTIISNETLRQALRADPSELERSKFNEEYLLITVGADTTIIGIKGFNADDTLRFRELIVWYKLQIEIDLVHNAFI